MKNDDISETRYILLKHDPYCVLYGKSGNLKQWDLGNKTLTFNDI